MGLHKIKKRLRKIEEIKSVMFCYKDKTLTVYLKETINPIIGDMVIFKIFTDNLNHNEFWWYGGRYLKILDKNFKIFKTYKNRIVLKKCDFGEWR